MCDNINVDDPYLPSTVRPCFTALRCSVVRLSKPWIANKIGVGERWEGGVGVGGRLGSGGKVGRNWNAIGYDGFLSKQG